MDTTQDVLLYDIFQVGKGLHRNGGSTVQGNTCTGCWRNVSSCVDGFSVAFWVNVVSTPEQHHKIEGIITAMKRNDDEGWYIKLINWHGTVYLKMQVNDGHVPGKQSRKTVSPRVEQWDHYIFTYKSFGLETPDFRAFVNGREGNGIYELANHDSFTTAGDNINNLVFGNLFINSGHNMNSKGILDEVILYDGVLDSGLAIQFYQHYNI